MGLKAGPGSAHVGTGYGSPDVVPVERVTHCLAPISASSHIGVVGDLRDILEPFNDEAGRVAKERDR